MTLDKLKSAILAALDKAEALEMSVRPNWQKGIAGKAGVVAYVGDDISFQFAASENIENVCIFARNTFAYHLAQDRKLVNATCERCGDMGEVHKRIKDARTPYFDQVVMSACSVCHGSRPAELQDLARALGVEG